MREVRRDRHWWRSGDGLGLVAGSPGTFFRVSAEGAKVLDALTRGEAVRDSPLLARLVAAGAVHPVPGPPVDPAQVTVVVPVKLLLPVSLSSPLPCWVRLPVPLMVPPQSCALMLVLSSVAPPAIEIDPA